MANTVNQSIQKQIKQQIGDCLTVRLFTLSEIAKQKVLHLMGASNNYRSVLNVSNPENMLTSTFLSLTTENILLFLNPSKVIPIMKQESLVRKLLLMNGVRLKKKLLKNTKSKPVKKKGSVLRNTRMRTTLSFFV